MGNSVEIKVKFKNAIDINSELLAKIDACFKKIGLKPDLKCSSSLSGKLVRNMTREKLSEVKLNKDDSYNYSYMNADGNKPAIVWINCCGNNKATELLIYTTASGYANYYSDQDKCIALTFQYLGELLQQQLCALGTKAIDERVEEPWFEFTETKRKTIFRLPLKEDTSSASIYLKASIVPDHIFLRKIDESMSEELFRPFWVTSFDSDKDLNISVDWSKRINVYQHYGAMNLVYKQETLNETYIDVRLACVNEQKSVDTIYIDFYIPLKELGIYKINQIRFKVLDQFRKKFNITEIKSYDFQM